MAENILIFRIGQLGDSLVSLPALKVLRTHYPDARIGLLYDHHMGSSFVLSEDLLRDTGLIDEFIPYPVGKGRWGKVRAMACYPNLLRKLRQKGYQRVFQLVPEWKSPLREKRDHLFFKLAGIREQYSTCAYRRPRSSSKPLESLEPEVDFFLRVLGEWGYSSPEPVPSLLRMPLTPLHEQEWSTWRMQQSLPEAVRLVGVGVGSKMQSKQWDLSRYQSVLSSLVEQESVFPVFFGGKEDAEAASDMIKALGVGANACGALSLKGAIRGLEDMALYLGNDTGTMHMAVAAGKTCVGIFSARDAPGKWYPYGDGHKVHRVSVDCEGCMLMTCIEQKKKCLTSIKVEDVLSSCRELLKHVA